MAKILIIDTCGGATVVCLSCNQDVDQICIPFDKSNKDIVLNGSVLEILKRGSIGFNDLDAYAVVVGTGSWTGARIGVTAIKAYHLVRQKPIITIQYTAQHVEPEQRLVDIIILARQKYRDSEFTAVENLQPYYDGDFKITPKSKT